MKKHLLTFLSLVALATYGQDGGRKPAVMVSMPNLSESATAQFQEVKSSSTMTTILVNPLSGTQVSVFTALSDTSTPGCSPLAGYVFGSNCYKDLEKAQFFPASSYTNVVTNASVTGCSVMLFKSGTKGTGGNSSLNVSLKIYSGTSNTNPPGALIGQQNATMGNILSAYTGTSNIFVYTYTFTTPAPVSGAFFAAISTPTTAGDTIVVPNQTASINNAWEKWDTGSWFSCSSSWGPSAAGNIGIVPVITGSLNTTYISNTDWIRVFQVFPNPSSGELFLRIVLDDTYSVNLSLTNMLGQEVLAQTWDVQWFGDRKLDVTHLPAGMYFLTVENNGKKHTEKIIIRH